MPRIVKNVTKNMMIAVFSFLFFSCSLPSLSFDSNIRQCYLVTGKQTFLRQFIL